MIGPADPRGWAKRPASGIALTAVFHAARSDRRFAAIRDKLIEDGIATEAGRLLFRWDGKEWVKHG
jgi:hypothetical protein